MNKDCGISTVTAVILLIAVTVLAAGVLTAAVLSSDTFSSAEPVSAVLTVSGETGCLVFSENRGIEQITLHCPKGEYIFSGESPVLIPENLIVSPASISARFSDGKETMMMRI